MERTIIACIQPRSSITASREEFETQARRFMRLAQAKSAQLTIFPELMGLMLAPSLISRFKLGFIKRADEGRQPGAGFLARQVGSVAGATGGALGGGFKGSLIRLLSKNGDALRDAYVETFSALAREYGTVLVAGSLYLKDAETGSIRNRAYVFSAAGEIIGYQDKLHLGQSETDLAVPGSALTVFETKAGRLGLLIGQDVLYPELARLLAIQNVDILAFIGAAAGPREAALFRTALAVRAEENQVCAAASFLLGPNYLDQGNHEEYVGQSALMVPTELSPKGDGILVQAGTMRAEAVVASELPMESLRTSRQTGRYRLRQNMNLGSGGRVLAELYAGGLSIDQAVEQHVGTPLEEPASPAPLEQAAPPEPPAPAEPATPAEPPASPELPPQEEPLPGAD